jgi:hypothetical protein
MPRRRFPFFFFLLGLCLVISPATAKAESPAPSVHWGALAYPDQYRTLDAGMTFNRFTDLSATSRYDSTIHETMGFNFATLSWTERFSDWGMNLTVGAGPTRDEPTNTFQNGFIHRALEFSPVPLGAVREATDFMIDGSLTRWGRLFGQHDSGFAGVGVSSGSLYHEGFVRFGARRLSFGLPVARLSAMGRYGQLYHSSAFNQVAGQSYLGQASMGFANYAGYGEGERPRWELELGVTWDRGLFVDPQGHAKREFFGTVALRFPYGAFETWNDAINFKDKGPTFGARLMFDILAIAKK